MSYLWDQSAHSFFIIALYVWAVNFKELYTIIIKQVNILTAVAAQFAVDEDTEEEKARQVWSLDVALRMS